MMATPEAARKLLLFDIDGTLLHSGGAGRRAMEAALCHVFGRPIPTDRVVFSGKTDPQIIREALAHAGFDPTADGRSGAVMEAFVAFLPRYLDPARMTLLPGLPSLLAHLAALPHVQLGLVTGNLQPTAYLKLQAVGLAQYFPFGAFGSDSACRDDLPAIALERARTHTGCAYRGREVVVIGDTEHDIRCGRGIGALSVGVCTGRYDRAVLQAHGPDVLLDDLGDLALFVRHVLAPA